MMRAIVAAAVFLIASVCVAQENTAVGKVGDGMEGVLVIWYGGDGIYLLKIEVRGGQAYVSPLPIDYELDDDPTPPPPPPDPDLSKRAEAIRDAALEVADDPKRGETAQGLAKAYRQVEEWIGDGTLSGQRQISKSAKTLADMVLKHQDAAQAWQPVRDKISSEWAKIAQRGGSDGDYAELLEDVADGLEASAPMAQVGSDFWEFLMKLFEFFVEYILPLIT